jgi:branched-chain amino acid transport system permease protein
MQQGGGPTLLAWVLFAGALAVGGLVASVFGWVVGLPSLRLRGDYLAIATLGFGEIIKVLLLNLDYVGGARGMTGIPKLTSFFWAGLAAVATVVACKNLVNSAHGRALLAIREDEDAAEAAGINTTWYKTQAFVISAFFAGVAGGLFGHLNQFLVPTSFNILLSIMVIAMVVLGGLGSTTGAIAAAVILTVLPEALRKFQEVRMLIFSGLLIVLMLVRPQGLLGDRELSRRWLAARGESWQRLVRRRSE